jgi:hypothetical protein
MWRVVLLSCGILAFAAAALAETYVVNPEGTADFPTIQAAVDYVQDGDIIELTDGVFRGSGNRDIWFLGKSIVLRSQSGDPLSCVIDCEGSAADPHFAFRFHGEGPDAILEGVTLTNGYSSYFGGAVFLSEASPIIRDCVFLRNTAESGGAINCDAWADPLILRCTFRENHSEWGGGAMCI